MKKKMNMKLKCFCLVFISIILFRCQGNVQKNKDCSKFENEIYQEVSDTSLAKEAFDFQKYLLEKFGEKSVKGINYGAYHLQFYSSFGYGKSVKFVNKNGVYSIAVKCITKEELYPDCKEYAIRIDKEEWNELERMIYEFNFWTEEDFKTSKDVLDGYAYILEGNRPEAKKCNKKIYKLVGRGSPKYDKIGALCDYILGYESQLKFKYEQSNKIK
ncbi:hypothetical protein [Haliscomenobacter sp.]|uniref:hypothetical protein n=1 Tax=Haliscomenobacter sp. TaxID=2717303 RepID=UPI003BA8D035